MNKIRKTYLYSDSTVGYNFIKNRISHFINDKKYKHYVKENIIRIINDLYFGIKITKK